MKRWLALMIVALLSLAVMPVRAAPGDIGLFSTLCRFSHANFDDPIKYPGQQGAAHRHSYFGNKVVDYQTTTETLVGGPTTCDRPEDHAAYWVPTLYERGQVLEPYEAHVYYRNTNVRNKTRHVPYPLGLRMIAGPASASDAGRVAEWECAPIGGTAYPSVPRTCNGKPLIALITFPSCWDGVNLTSEDQSHVTYPWKNLIYPKGCPTSHPVVLPELTEHVRYIPRYPKDLRMTLSSGPTNSLHADFWNAWEAPKLDWLVRTCLLGGVECGTIGAEDPPADFPGH